MDTNSLVKKVIQKDRYGNSVSIEYDIPKYEAPPEPERYGVYVAPPEPERYGVYEAPPNYFEGRSLPMAIPESMTETIQEGVMNEYPGTHQDTVPAMLTPGEYVINREATEKYEPLLEKINNEGIEMQEQKKNIIEKSFGTPKFYGIDLSMLGFNEGGPISLIDFLKGQEQLSLEAYPDGGGYSIGYGSSGAKKGDKITEEEALKLLNKDLEWVNKTYDDSVTNKDLNVNQANAVKSLIYNIGGTNWNKSKAKDALNKGDYDTFNKEMKEFQMSQGKVLPGLQKRREAEMNLFNTPAFSDVPTPMGKPEIQGDNNQGFSLGNLLGISSAQAQTVNNPNLPPPVPITLEENKEIKNYEPLILTPTQRFYDGEFTSMNPESFNLNENLIINENAPPIVNNFPVPEGSILKTEDEVKDFEAENAFVMEENYNISETIKNEIEDLRKEKINKLSRGDEDGANSVQNEIDKKEEIFKVHKEQIKRHKDKKVLDDNKDIAQLYRQDDTSYIPEINNNNDKKKDALEEILKPYDNVTDFSMDNNAGEIEKKGSGVGSKIIDGITSAFKDAFADLFDDGELARMAIMYAGSRAMGYDHGSSFNFSMRNYLERVDADIAQREENIASKTFIETYTPQSLADYRRSGDFGDLKEKAGDALTLDKIKEKMYLRGHGQINVYTGSDKIDYIKNPIDGTPIPVSTLGPLLEKWNDDIHSDSAVTNNFKILFEESMAKANSDLGLENQNKATIINQKLATQAHTIYRDILRRNGMSVNDSHALKTNISYAIEDFTKQLALWKQEGEKGIKPNFESFVNKAIWEPSTGLSQQLVANTAPSNLKTIQNKIRTELGMRSTEPNYNRNLKDAWQLYEDAWMKLGNDGRNEWVSKAERFNKKNEEKTWDSFTYWVSKTSVDDLQKILES